jgi:DNA-binding response OmpR family regulator
MLVSAESCEEIRRCLQATGCDIVSIDNGSEAIRRAQRATFNLAVLVSTGRSMDMAETVLNLRDARPAMPMVIVSAELDPEEARIIADACPTARSLSLDELAAHLSTYESGRRVAGRRAKP